MFSGATITARLRAVSGRSEARLSLAKQLAEHGAGMDAVRHIASAARGGSSEAQARLGLCYLRGHGVPANQAEARYWLEKAAQGGNAAAQTELASLALRGVSGPYQRGPFPTLANDTKPDLNLAASLARRAAAGGSAEAKALLALILTMAPANAETPDEADTLYRESAEAGWPLGQLGHAMTLLRKGTARSFREADTLLSAAADSGLPTAHFLLGAMAESEVGGGARAEQHHRIAAEHGHTGAKTRLGLALLTGRATRHNLVEGETWLRRAALDGDKVAAAVLGDYYASPERDPANLAEAALWYRRAAELGHPGAARVLARVISSGVEGESDPGEAVAWLCTAIEGGESAAWGDLGGLIASSILPRDQLSALHGWLQKMIQEDRPEAGFYVGICVNGGIGTPANEKLARRYYLWAAAEGVIEAMVAAAEMLLNGRGGRADPALAHALFAYAGERDHAGALYALSVMAADDRNRAMTYLERAAALGHSKARLLLARQPAEPEFRA
jgi:uncharacterized protein